jgi:hypothetical protein
LLSRAKTPEQYQEYYASLNELMPRALRGQVMGMFPPNFSPEAVAQAAAVAGATDKTKGGTSDYAQFLKRYATSINKPVEALTAEDELAARKKYGQADDAARRPFAPIVVVTPQGPMVTTGDSRQTVVPIRMPGGESVGNKLTGTMVEKVAGMEASDAILQELKTLKKDEWLGPITGRYTENVTLKTPATKLPEGLAKFAAQSNTLKGSGFLGRCQSSPTSRKSGTRTWPRLRKTCDNFMTASSR